MERTLLAGAGDPHDTGEPDPRLAGALAAYAVDPAREPEVLAVLGQSRLLVPVVALPGEVELGADGLARDKISDMATVLLRGADGRTALLCFSGLDALARWDPHARPVPVPGRLAAQAAVQEAAAAMLVDVAGPVTYVVEGADLGALAAGWAMGRVGDRAAWIGDSAIGGGPE